MNKFINDIVKKKGEISYSWAMSNNGLIHINDYNNQKINCPSCDGKMIARKGIKVRSHFAHSPNNKCRGPERIEHLLSKDILLKNNKLFLPIAKKSLNGKDYEIPSYIVNYKNPIAEKWVNGFIPDIIISTENHDFFIVEIRVTHSSDTPKRIWVVNKRIPTIEIDCRNIMNMNPDLINDYVLYKAPRKWLFSPELANEIIHDKKKIIGLIKEDISIKKERVNELISQSDNIINLYNIISTKENDPKFTQVEKNNYIFIKDSKSPFKFSNSYIGTLLNTYKNTDVVLRILKNNKAFKYDLTNDLFYLLKKHKNKDFSFIYHINMLNNIIINKRLKRI